MTATVPTAADHSVLEARVTALEAPTASSWLAPEQFGAVAGKDCTKAFQALFDAIDASAVPDAGGGVPVVTKGIQLGAGPYLVSDSVMRAKPGRAQGLTIRGLGKRASEIVMTGSAPLFVNQDRWMGVRFYNVSFRSTNPAASYLYSYSTGACQDWAWTDCEWRGTWKYGVGLDGPETSNCNSEFVWSRCHVNGSYEQAFLYGGMSPEFKQQDQFLNYAFDACKVEYDSGTFIRMDRGGYIKCQGGSYIIKGDKGGRFFHFPLAGHADSVQKLAVRDIRFELRNSNSQVINSAWNGHIVFDNVSDTALGFKAFSAALPAHEYTNPGCVSYRNCDLVGKHVFHQMSTPVRQRVIYDSCTRKNNRTAATFLVKDGAYASKLVIRHRDDADGIA